MTYEIIVPLECSGKRIDVFLTGSDGIPTRAMAQKLLENGHIILNGKPASKNHKIATGNIIICTIPPPTPINATPENIPLDILYEDDNLLVINKPRGLVVHPGAGNWQGTMVNALLHHCKLSSIGGELRPGIVHRLDKDTSGLIVVAKNDITHQGLAAQLADNSMTRIYKAVCMGNVKQDKIRIDAPIGRHPVNRKKMAIITALNQRARHAVTYVETLNRFGKHSLISARLETGRTHQIRVHMAHIGHPVLGDGVYGGSCPHFAQQGQVLHAGEISFVHPVTGEVMGFTAPLPDYFENAIEVIMKM